MEPISSDLTIILDGYLRRDDSDRIGALTRRVQAFEQQQAMLHTTIVGLLQRTQDTVQQALLMLQEDLTATIHSGESQLTALHTQAVELAADLETLLTKTGAAQVTQEDLDMLDTQVQQTTADAQDALTRMQELGNG